jgi:NIPSNAP
MKSAGRRPGRAAPEPLETGSAVANDKVYIHEFIDIVGHHRAAYMDHMTANWSPIAQEERHQLCYGVWGIVGSTGQWPSVVNMWEEEGWDGLAASFGHELGHAHLQDPKLARWWARAAEFRSGGFDRILVPPGGAADFLELAREVGGAFYAEHGWQLIGAFETALRNDDEAFLLWSIPSWDRWGAAEAALRAGHPWREVQRAVVGDMRRILLVDAPLSPLRTGRQPARSDRDESWSED